MVIQSLFKLESNTISLSNSTLLNLTIKDYIQDLINVSIYKNEAIINKNKDIYGFVPYEKYTRRDVCQLLNHPKDDASTMYGMKQINNNTCIFVTYHKSEGIDGSEYLDGKPNYADTFIDPHTFTWNSKIGNGPESKYMKEFTSGKIKRLFVKKVTMKEVIFITLDNLIYLKLKVQ